jgi:hypothetical protein
MERARLGPNGEDVPHTVHRVSVYPHGNARYAGQLTISANHLGVSFGGLLPNNHVVIFRRDEMPIVTLVGQRRTCDWLRIHRPGQTVTLRLLHSARDAIAMDLETYGWDVARSWS